MHSICNLDYRVSEKTPIALHNGCNYGHHFIIKELTEEFEKKNTCLVENTEKYITFTVPIGNQVTRIDKNGEPIAKNISYTLQFIDRAQFMENSLSNVVNDFSEASHQIKCKQGHDD